MRFGVGFNVWIDKVFHAAIISWNTLE
jgi:hypothetical protein